MTIVRPLIEQLGHTTALRDGILVIIVDGREEVIGDVDDAWAWLFDQRKEVAA